ncbi:nuclear transport factor 2 family protein [Jongsikchunia kroppenstedtii]|uniref:nuclear transport factor 2 family protein n=1 Tax=Jongsikchunia kroppenstedtii TaxID=1121721 RepID=UPI000371E7F3|nr:nuclear transport factor 2 family protein [Jongsikchunia kroppenstedtii]
MSNGFAAINNLIGVYAERIDSGDFVGVGQLFAHATMSTDMGTSMTGADEIQGMYEQWTRRYPDNGTPHTKHLMTNLIIDVDEDAGTGSCRTYYTVLQSTPELPLQPIITGTYRDTFERVDGLWRFASRYMTTDYVGDLSQHLLQELG